MNQELKEISKFLSYVLRHAPQAIDITLDDEGWTNVSTLIERASASGRALTRHEIEDVVTNNDKERFSFSEDGLSIRAVQGHSAEAVSISYLAKAPPQFLYHGTAAHSLESIQKEGLHAASRQYVHLSKDEKVAATVGARHGKPLVLKVEALRLHELGLEFFEAENGVWLTKHVPPDGFTPG